MLLHYSKGLYSKTALLKAAYHFTDNFYVYLDQNVDDFLIDITPKVEPEDPNIKGIFSNELLAQATREKVVEQTKHIRELLLGRAFSSTIIDDPAKGSNSQASTVVSSLPLVEQKEDELFEDWFDKYEG